MSGINDISNWYEPSDELLSLRNVSFDEKEKEDHKEETDREKLIEINQVDLDYQVDRGNVHALDKVSFNIFPGEFICVLGPSGCGKSTLLKILAGFIRPSGGDVKLDGQPIDGVDWHRGVVFQNPPLFEWYSVRKNIEFGPK
ncbi:MAG: ATP-binding cassette domain-containing protein, partial [Eubacterium sp.]